MAGSRTPKRYSATDLDDSNIAAGAGIVTSKLADGADFVKRTGSVAMTGSLAMGNNKITGLQTATNTDEAVNLGQMNTAIAALNTVFDSAPSARAATTGNITISNPATAVFDGVTLTTGQILFVRAQSAPAENGHYVFNTSGTALVRITQLDEWAEFPGKWFAVEEGTTYADTVWLYTVNQGGTLGTTAITFVQIATTGLSSSNFVDQETPSGTVNGSNTAFTLANTPIAGSVHLWLENLLLYPGAGNDYTISGAAITMLTAPLTGERLRATYRK